MAAIFGNTGVEYPESLSFARKLGKEWGGVNFHEAPLLRTTHEGLKYEAQRQVLEWLVNTGRVGEVLKTDGKLKTTRSLEKAATPEMWERFRRQGLVWPKGTAKSYWWCVDQYGWPILGKAASMLQARRINIDCFLRFSDTKSDDEKLMRYYEMLWQCKISQGCCDVLKKEPSKVIQRELRVDLLFLGMMASESFRRKRTFAQKGPLFEVVTESRKIKMPVYHCHPLGVWGDDDIWEYIRRFDVPYSPLYDRTYTDNAGKTQRIKRNGCIGCYTDYGRKDSHMYVLRQTHPEAWRAVMKRGMAAEIQKLRQVPQDRPSIKDYARLAILDIVEGSEGLAWAMETRPCAFD
jgi:3'-phosphoadenosine 5'-phosphosulfate sulfotransferase (PAPS reductase)/FAD synthetase